MPLVCLTWDVRVSIFVLLSFICVIVCPCVRAGAATTARDGVGPLAVGAVAAENAQWNRQSLKEIAASLKSAHKAIGHCARLCLSAHTTFTEEAQTVADAKAQVDALIALAP